MKKLVVARRICQSASCILFVFILWMTTYPLSTTLNPSLFFQSDPLTVFTTALSERVLIPGIGMCAVFLITTSLLGRFYCGWLCPLGAAIDAFSSLDRSCLANDRVSIPRPWRYIKYVLLSIIGITALCGVQVAWALDPIVIFGRFVSLDLIPASTQAIERSLVYLIQTIPNGHTLMDFYRALHKTALGVKIHYFPHGWTTLATFCLVISMSLAARRSWCRVFCPLGACYGVASTRPTIRLNINGCTSCGICDKVCRVGALKAPRYSSSECVMCMDCIYACPNKALSFGFRNKKSIQAIAAKSGPHDTTINRRSFIALIAGGAMALFAPRACASEIAQPGTVPIRPPGSLTEDRFPDTCIRCGNCMKVCPTNVLQPTGTGVGLLSLWTPRLINAIGYCEYNCTLCGEVCPTGAIGKISRDEKVRTVIGFARIDVSSCLPWKENKGCIVCEEHCPVPKKAIKLESYLYQGATIQRPAVDTSLCIGCGICENKCPVRPKRAIKVYAPADYY